MTKDVVYLRGLVELLWLLQSGLDLHLLFIGKFGIKYLPVVRELLSRKILIEPRLRPRVLDSPAALERLERIRIGATVLDLVCG